MILMYCVAQATYESLSNDFAVCAGSCTTHLVLRRGFVRQSYIISQTCWDWEVLHLCNLSLHNFQRTFIEGHIVDIIQTRVGGR